MTEHPNVDLLRRGYTAFATGDMPTLDALFADTVVWHVSGRSQMSGDHKGKEQVFGAFGRLAELSGGTFTLDVHTLLADDEHGVALTRARGVREGRNLDVRDIDTFHIRDGRVVEIWSTSLDPYENDEFWG
jgi:Ketosteroid isomerase-related protein